MNRSGTGSVNRTYNTDSPPTCHLDSHTALNRRPDILNIAAYRFVALDDLPALRRWLEEVSMAAGLRGTVLLAAEGINLAVAGSAEGIAALRAALDADHRLAGLGFRQSWSSAIPFKRLKVGIRKEIIAFGVSGIDPARAPAPALAPEMLKAWLEEGREIVLLDTRNAFEVEHGSFAGAVHLGNHTFREFAAAARAFPPSRPGTPVVTFCTGGIRCEKAAPLLLQLGHRDVFQLSGGILGYLEHAGPDHYEGACFVFDERIGLGADLSPQNPEQL